eukprot:6196421-Pleurochrysis_carterae.AAC.2
MYEEWPISSEIASNSNPLAKVNIVEYYLTAMNFRHYASVTYSPVRHWESGERMAPLTQHSPSIH